MYICRVYKIVKLILYLKLQVKVTVLNGTTSLVFFRSLMGARLMGLLKLYRIHQNSRGGKVSRLQQK